MSQEPFVQLSGNALSNLYINGCQVSRTSNTTVTVNNGQVRDSMDAFDIAVSSPLVVNFAAQGVNGLDTGTFAASTPYYIFVLYDQTQANPPCALASLSPTAPVLPALYGVTYSHFRCVGWVLSDGSTHLLPFTTTGSGNVQHYEWDAPIAVLTGGTSNVAADVSLATAVPGVNYGKVQLQGAFTPNAASDTWKLKPKVATNYTFTFHGQVAAVILDDVMEIIPSTNSGAATVTYVLSTASAALTLHVTGFDINL